MVDQNSLPYGPAGLEHPPKDENEVRARHESNRATWNEGAIEYTAELDEAIAFLKAGKSNVHPIERANLGDLRAWCKTAIHLQCASGRDTLSLWNEGVERVIGVDISDVHIENARKMSAALNAPAEWYRCDVLDTPHELDGSADLVYTGRGALCWLQDLNAWADVVYRLLKPGGIFHIFEGHPITWLFDMEAEEYIYSGINYFQHYESSQGWPTTYIGELEIPVEKQSLKHESLWTLADVFTALRRTGLIIEKLGEYPDAYWEEFPRLKPELRGKIPNTFAIMARKP